MRDRRGPGAVCFGPGWGPRPPERPRVSVIAEGAGPAGAEVTAALTPSAEDSAQHLGQKMCKHGGAGDVSAVGVT